MTNIEELKKRLEWFELFADAVQGNHRVYTSACEHADLEQNGIECADCGEKCHPEQLIPWRYEPEVKLCENCTENRDDEEQEDEF